MLGTTNIKSKKYVVLRSTFPFRHHVAGWMQRFIYEKMHTLYGVGFFLQSLGKTKRMKLCPVCLYGRTFLTIKCLNRLLSDNFFYRCTVHSDIHTVHSPTDAHILKL